jgi:hypothetical protein
MLLSDSLHHPFAIRSARDFHDVNGLVAEIQNDEVGTTAPAEPVVGNRELPIHKSIRLAANIVQYSLLVLIHARPLRQPRLAHQKPIALSRRASALIDRPPDEALAAKLEGPQTDTRWNSELLVKRNRNR